MQHGVPEGPTRIPPTPAGSGTGPAARVAGQAFYNPAMALNRDLSVLLGATLAARKGRGIDIADALCGAGARALRLASETPEGITVHANDADAQAVHVLKEAARHAGLEPGRLHVHHGGAHAFLATRRFDIVDVDPFGSPAPFLDAALRATRHDGLACLTATDTAALCGTRPKACRRRYGAEHRLHPAPWRAEVGLRILAGAAVQAAARLERGARPVLCVWGGHWMRVVLEVKDGARRADAATALLGWAVQDENGLGHLQRDPPIQKRRAGPLWAGALHDAALVARLQEEAAGRPLARPEATPRLLTLLADEADAPAFWIEAGTLQQTLQAPAPRRDRLIQALLDGGHAATRTHLDPQGVRTDAGMDGLADAWQRARMP